MPKNYQISQYDLPICVGGHLDVELPDGDTSTRRHHAGAHGGGHRQDHARQRERPDPRRRLRADRLQPRRRAARRVRERARHALAGGGRRVPARRSARPSSRSTSATSGWRRGRSAATRTSRCGPSGPTAFGTKVEIKNMNSVRSLERALAFEIERQTRRSRPASRSCRRRGTGTRTPAPPRACAPRRRRSTTGTSRSPTSPRSSPTGRGSSGSARRCRSCPPPAAPGTRATLGLRPDVVRVLVADREATVAVRGDGRAGRGAGGRRQLDHAGPGGPAEPGAGDAASKVTAGRTSWTCFAWSRRTPSRAPARSRRWRRRSAPATDRGRSSSGGASRQVSDTGELGAIAERVIADNADAAEKFRSGQRGRDRVPRRTGDEGLRRLREPQARAGAAARAADGLTAEPAVRVDQARPPRYPWWQLVLLGLAGLAESPVWPLRRMWRSDRPLDAYALAHFTSAAGDALLAISLADSVFFSLPGRTRRRLRVALYLGLTMLPLALAGPLLVIPLDRAGPRRWISLIAALVRAVRRGRSPRRGSTRSCCSRRRSPCSSRPRCTRSRRTASRWPTRIPTRG